MSYSHLKQCKEVSLRTLISRIHADRGKSVHRVELLGEHNTLLRTTGLYADVPILTSELCEDHVTAQSQTGQGCVLRVAASAPLFFPCKSLPA